MSDFALSFTTSLLNILPAGFSLPQLTLLLIICCLLSFFLIIFFALRIYSKNRLLLDTRQSLAIAKKEALTTEKQNNIIKIKNTELLTLLKAERRHNIEKLKLLDEAKDALSLQFATVGQQIFDEKNARFDELSEKRLTAILQPLNQQLNAFKKEINDLYHNDSRERVSLKHEIIELRALNQQINQEAINLTRALKGDKKLQGNWGELVLERILEQSGLRAGQEYIVQTGFRNSNNRLMKPDIIINLPGGKNIIIDSKVSLNNWERYVSDEDAARQEDYLNSLIKDIRNHITTLSDKNYPELVGVHSLDFILMFMPMESVFATVCQHDETLIDTALTHNIIIVTPTTLLATLRTVENIWHREQQGRNGREIAKQAGIMYDKFRAMLEEFEKLGKQLSTCQTTYDTIMARLARNRGNLVTSARRLKDLGVQSKKELPKSLTDITDGK